MTDSSTSPDLALSEAELSALREGSIEKTYGPGDVIFELGDVGDALYVVDQGAVQLRFPGDKPPKNLHPPEVFGELAFIVGEHTRTASAVAVEPASLLYLEHLALDQLFESCPHVIFALIRRTCSYLLRSEKGLIDRLRKKNEELQKTLDFLRRTREELDYQELLAQTDPLTGLYNRRCFQEQLPRMIERTQKEDQDLTLLLLDLDGFKSINDTLGHAVGDEILKRVASTLQSSIRNSDLPCRLGGDEFVVVFPELSPKQGRERARLIREKISSIERRHEDRRLGIGASIGAAVYRAGETAEELVDRADAVMYEAKEGGRNRVVWAD